MVQKCVEPGGGRIRLGVAVGDAGEIDRRRGEIGIQRAGKNVGLLILLPADQKLVADEGEIVDRRGAVQLDLANNCS